MTTTIAPAATTIAPRTGTASATDASTATWASVADGLWAGTRDGEFLGTIEFTHGGFEAADHHGTSLGRAHSLTAAKRLLDGEPDTEREQMLRWSDERTVLALGWLAFGAAAIAAVSIATQFFA